MNDICELARVPKLAEVEAFAMYPSADYQSVPSCDSKAKHAFLDLCARVVVPVKSCSDIFLSVEGFEKVGLMSARAFVLMAN